MSEIELLTMIAVSGILFFFIWISLASVSMFGKFGDFIIAVGVTIICVNTLNFTPAKPTPVTAPPQLTTEDSVTITEPAVKSAPIKPAEPSTVKPDKPQKRWFFLLPYEALGVTILAGLLIWLLLRWRRSKLFSLVRSKKKTAHSNIHDENPLLKEEKKVKSENAQYKADLKSSAWSFDDRTKR